MVRFRRNYVPGGTDFFTLTLRDRRSRALTDHVGLLRETFRDVREAQPFDILAIVVLPEHLHAVLALPEGDADYSGRWKAIKAQFSHALVKAGVRLEKDERGEYRFWRRRFWEHTIRDERDLETHVDYIRFRLSVVLRPKESRRFVWLPRRWAVERTFSWLNRCRRPSKDYERPLPTSETWIYLAMIKLMANRLA